MTKSVLFFILLAVTEASPNAYLLHLTDVHLDARYTVGAPTKCVLGNTGMGCCRKDNIPIPGSSSAGPWGSDGCDTPVQLLNATLQWIATNIPQIDAVVWTGDTADHHDLSQTWASNENEIAIGTALIQHWLPQAKVLPCLGNHDGWPIDQLYPNLTAPIFLPQLASLWSPWLTTDALETFRQGGFYSQTVYPGMRAVVLNSLYLDKNNLAVSQNETVDLGGQWAWFSSTLLESRYRGEKVWIVGHIPPGSSEAVEWFSGAFQNISAEYADVILGQFWGHSHRDEFRLLRDAFNRVVGVVFIAPSLMIDGKFPGVRLYTFNRSTFEILDFTQYWINFTLQLQNPSFFVGMFPGYSAKASYSMVRFDATAWSDLDQRMRNSSALFDVYYRHYMINTTYPACNTTACKLGFYCDVEWVVSADHDRCTSGVQ